MMRAVIVGCGSIGPVHMNAVKECGSAQLVGVCDIDRQRAGRYVAEMGCRAYYSFEDVLADRTVESVHVCTPHYLHAPMVEQAVAAGKHVVVEKPAAMNRQEFEKLLRIEAESKQKICAIVQNRENVCAQLLREILDSGKEGPVRGMSACLRWNRDADYYATGDWRGKWATEGGGVMINQAVHLLDLMCWLGGNVVSAKTSISNRGIPEIEVEDTADALLTFENGAKAFFSATNCYSFNAPNLLDIHFEKCTYRYADDMLVRIESGELQLIARDSEYYAGKKYWGGGHRSAIGKFYDSFGTADKGGEVTDFVHLRDVRNTMNVLYSFYEQSAM